MRKPAATPMPSCCYKKYPITTVFLQDDTAKANIPQEDRLRLLPNVATAFQHKEKYDLAAQLFREAGEPAQAGEVYVKAGKLQEAAACMKEAGRPKDAARIGGRFYEGMQKWSEAGMASGGSAPASA